jgi:hypothetical protein
MSAYLFRPVTHADLPLLRRWRAEPHVVEYYARALRAYEKAGFKAVGGPLDTRWGRAILMERWPGSSRPEPLR